MLDILKLNLVLEFEVGTDASGNTIHSKVTIANLRDDLTSSEIYQIARVFESLVDHLLTDVHAVFTHRVLAPQQP